MLWNKIAIIFILVFCILFYRLLVHRPWLSESFATKINNNHSEMVWSDDLLKRFREYQNTTFNNSYQFNMEMLQQQASPQDAEYLVKNNRWFWSDETQQLYLDAVSKSTMIRILPEESLNRVMKIYNENAMRQLLSWNTKEGDFLLSGVTVESNKKDDEQDDQDFTLLLNGEKNEDVIRCDGERGMIWKNNNKKINNADLPALIPGFQFGDKGVCNPCVALQDEPDYSCPFSLNLDGNDSVSSVWKTFWGNE